ALERSCGQRPETHALTARADRRQQAIGPLGEQEERDAWSRLFERLEQRVRRFRMVNRKRDVSLGEDHASRLAFERRELREGQELAADQLDLQVAIAL